METFSAIACLLLPSAFLGLKSVYEYGKRPSFGIGGVIAFIFLTIYVLLVAFMGADRLQGIESEISGFNLKRFGAFFVFPGIGLSLILFPKIAAEYSDNYFKLVSGNALGAYSLIGWAVLVLSGVSALVWYSS